MLSVEMEFSRHFLNMEFQVKLVDKQVSPAMKIQVKCVETDFNR